MKRLFIIGNGFDIAHGLKTKYSDFEKYLMKNFPDADPENALIPEPNEDGLYDDNEVVSFLLKIISDTKGDAWKNLENTLGELNYSDFLTSNDECENTEDDWKNAYFNEDNAKYIRNAVEKIRDYFSDWINQIDISQVQPYSIFEKFINKQNDLFLTFNYTMTLENVYKIQSKNILHIHGKQGEQLIFGHGNPNDISENYEADYTGSENYIEELHEALRKNTSTIINDNMAWFNSLGTLDQIYSYGFSFAQVDLVYIQQLCKSTTKNTTWYLSDDKSNFNKFHEIIKKYGFKGDFEDLGLLSKHSGVPKASVR